MRSCLPFRRSGDGGHRAGGAVADVVGRTAGRVERAFADPGDDAVAYREPPVSAGNDLLASDFAGHLQQAVGETVQLPPGPVPAVDHRVLVTVPPSAPPPFQEIEVEVDLVAHDVEVARRLKLGQRIGDAPLAQCVGGGRSWALTTRCDFLSSGV